MKDKFIYDAIAAFERATGIKAEWLNEVLPQVGFDGILQLTINNRILKFTIQAKKEIRAVTLFNFVLTKNKHNNLVVVAEVIYPKIREELRNRGINYIDTIGNIYLKYDELLIFIEGKKTDKPIKENAGRAFNKAGLKFIYYLLTDKEFINKTFREKAAICKTAVGNINYITNDLVNQGFLRKKTKNEYYLPNRDELIKQWVMFYEKKLKPTCYLGAFRFPDKEQTRNWIMLDVDFTQTKWGGEPAGAILTNYLKPEVLILYTNEKRIDIMQKYKLIPDENGDVKLYKIFWNNTEESTKTVNPLIIYADLVNTLNQRTDEIANMIYNEFLKG